MAHETRKRLTFYIRENPGTSFQSLKGIFKLNDGTLRYHLNYLRKKKKIVQVISNNRRTYLLEGASLGKEVKLNREQKRLIDIIGTYPGITRNELLERTRQSRKILSYHLTRLSDLRLIWKIKEGGKIGYRPITKEELFKEAFAIIVDKFLENEIDLQTFNQLKNKLDMLIKINDEKK